LVTPGETFYGQVQRYLGDRRFVVDNVATGYMVPCRLKGSISVSGWEQKIGFVPP
jgi:hypothetical protein